MVWREEKSKLIRLDMLPIFDFQPLFGPKINKHVQFNFNLEMNEHIVNWTISEVHYYPLFILKYKYSLHRTKILVEDLVQNLDR